MKKYFNVVRNAWKSGRVYKLNYAMSFLVVLLPMIITLFLWIAVYSKGTELIKGFSLSQMITYAVFSIFILEFTYPFLDYEYSYKINSGEIDILMIKPISIKNYHLAEVIGYKIPALIVNTILVCLFLMFFSKYIFIQTDIRLILISFGFLIISFFLATRLSLLLSFLAFWFEKTDGFSKLYDLFVIILIGGLVPLRLLPGIVSKINYFLPFRLMCNDIVEIYLGLKSFRFILVDFSLLTFWVVLSEILISVFYNLGRNVYKGNN